MEILLKGVIGVFDFLVKERRDNEDEDEDE